MYTPRRRKYSNYRYRTQKYFAPTISKAPVPNYYQKKGRILQSSALRMNDEDTGLISQKVLDKYYKTLVEYKYPIPTPIPPGPGIDITQFDYNFLTPVVSILDWPDQINLQYLYNNYVQTAIQNLPNAPAGYEYNFQLTSINFSYNKETTVRDYHQFSFSWSSSLSNSPISLITKSLDTSGSIDFNGELIAIPTDVSLMRYTQIAFTNSSINYRWATFATNDPIVTDDSFYPLITSKTGQETYDATIAIQKPLELDNSYPKYRLNIKIFLVPNQF